MKTDKPRISAVLITLNEEKKLEPCLRSLSFADQIVLVDGGSGDRTVEIAKQCGAQVFERPFDDFSSQKNFSIDRADGEWVLSIDADERISDELGREIVEKVSSKEPTDGYWIRRENILFGKKMRFGPCTNDDQLRLFKKGKGRFAGLIHERVQIEGPVGRLSHPMLHFSCQNMEEYRRRFDKYTAADARTVVERGVRPHLGHLYLRPLAAFFYYYVMKLGFLDGWAGLKNIFLASFYIHVKYTKARVLLRQKGGLL